LKINILLFISFKPIEEQNLAQQMSQLSTSRTNDKVLLIEKQTLGVAD